MKSSDLKKILEFIRTLNSLNLYSIQIFLDLLEIIEKQIMCIQGDVSVKGVCT